MDADAPYVLVRYANGAAKGFNYVTGEELPIENAFSDVSFLEFAAGFADQFFGADGGSLEFADLKELEHQLTLSPITDSQFNEAVNRLEQTEEGKDGAAIGPDDGSGAEGQNGTSSKEGSNQEAGQPGEAVSEETADSGESQTEKEKSGQSEADLNEAGQNQDEEGGNSEPENSESEDGKADNGKTETDKPESDRTEDGKNEADLIQSEQDGAGKENADADRTNPDREIQTESGKAEADRAEAGRSEKAEAEKAEAEKEKQKLESENGEALSADGQKQNKAAGRTVSYAYAFNTKDGSSRLYNTEDLLSAQAGELMDEEEKLELLEAAGLVTEEMYMISSGSEEQSRIGITAFAAAAAVGLAWFLIRRKRRYEE